LTDAELGPNRGDGQIQRLLASQQNEIQADNLGLTLHVDSFLDSFGEHDIFKTTATVGALRGLCAMNLLLGRLSVLGDFVDERAWESELSHPPDLQRLLFFLGAAKVFGGQELYDALDKQRVDLFGFNAEIWNECDSRRAAVE